MALTDATITVQSKHTFIAQHNVAKKDGGAIALLSGARLSLLEARPCPSSCPQTGIGITHCDQACMSAECNWQGGMCVLGKMDRAGADALLPCNREKCPLRVQTNAIMTESGCWSSCLSGSCDWSRNLCRQPRGNLLACPLMDAAAFAAINDAHAGRIEAGENATAPIFLTDGNSQGGFGRCSGPCRQPAAPPDASLLLGAGMVGTGALHLIPAENTTDPAGWVHVGINAHHVKDKPGLGFTVESWIKVPSACHSVDRMFSFVVAGGDYAVALRGNRTNTSLVFFPLFFWTAAPRRQCLAGPQVMTASTGSIGDGPGSLPRNGKDGPVLCSWILFPGGSVGGFKEVTLIFTEFLLTSHDSLDLYSCLDSNCTSKSEATTFKGSRVPPPFVSTTPVMLVILTQDQGFLPSSPGFTASFAGTPGVLASLQANFWHHLSLTVSKRGLAALWVNGTQQHAHQLLWDPLPSQNAMLVGTHATAIGRGSPAWQDGGDFGYACLAVDELRFWTSERSAINISSSMYASCAAIADGQLAACYNFDQVSSAAGLDDFFADSSPNKISSVVAAHGSPYRPWCVNIDDDGQLKLDTEKTASPGKSICCFLLDSNGQMSAKMPQNQ